MNLFQAHVYGRAISAHKTSFRTEHAAQVVADFLNSTTDEPSEEYHVVMGPDCRYSVAYIESGEFIGWL